MTWNALEQRIAAIEETPPSGMTPAQVEQLDRATADIQGIEDALGEYALKDEIPSTVGLATESYVDEKFNSIDIPEVDLSNYYTMDQVEEYVDIVFDNIPETDLSGYQLKDEAVKVYRYSSNVALTAEQVAELQGLSANAIKGVIYLDTYIASHVSFAGSSAYVAMTNPTTGITNLYIANLSDAEPKFVVNSTFTPETGGGSGGAYTITNYLALTDADKAVLDKIVDTRTFEQPLFIMYSSKPMFVIGISDYSSNYVKLISFTDGIRYDFGYNKVNNSLSPSWLGTLLTSNNYSSYISSGGWAWTSDRYDSGLYNAKEVFIAIYPSTTASDGYFYWQYSHWMSDEEYKTLGGYHTYKNIPFVKHYNDTDNTNDYWYYDGSSIVVNNEYISTMAIYYKT